MNMPENYPEIGEETAENLEQFRDFKGIWIPRSIWLSSLSTLEKCIVAEIDSLSKGNEGCFASNKWLAKFFGLSENRITCILAKLKKIGILTQESFDGRRRVIRADLVKTNVWKQKGRPCESKRADLVKVKGLGGVNPLIDNDLQSPLIIKDKTKSIKKDFLAENNKFDPEDLPSHLGNNKAVAEAWSRFVQSRKEIKKRITPVAYKMLIKKMLAHSPEEVVAALDTSSERGYTGVFFNDNPPTRTHTVQGDMFPVKLDPDAQRLADFAASVLGNEIVRPRTIQDIVNQMRSFYSSADKLRDPHDPLKRMGPTEHYTWDKFFREWLEFLEEKQASHFELRSVNDLQVTGCRWREYVKRCEEYSCYDWSTGRRRE